MGEYFIQTCLKIISECILTLESGSMTNLTLANIVSSIWMKPFDEDGFDSCTVMFQFPVQVNKTLDMFVASYHVSRKSKLKHQLLLSVVKLRILFNIKSFPGALKNSFTIQIKINIFGEQPYLQLKIVKGATKKVTNMSRCQIREAISKLRRM